LKCWSISGMYVKVYVLIRVHLLVLSIQLSIKCIYIFIYLFIYLYSCPDVQFAPKGPKACVLLLLLLLLFIIIIEFLTSALAGKYSPILGFNNQQDSARLFYL